MTRNHLNQQNSMNKQVLTIRGVKPTSSKRIDYIDLIKGIAIIGVVWSHTVHPQWYNVTYINALFFFLSGFFFKEEPFPAFLKKKVKTLLSHSLSSTSYPTRSESFLTFGITVRSTTSTGVYLRCIRHNKQKKRLSICQCSALVHILLVRHATDILVHEQDHSGKIPDNHISHIDRSNHDLERGNQILPDHFHVQ